MAQQEAQRGAKRARHGGLEAAEAAPAQQAQASEAANDQVDEPGITKLDRLCAPVEHQGAGLSKAEVNLLLEHGIHCVETIAFMPVRKLMDIKGIGEQKANKIHDAARK